MYVATPQHIISKHLKVLWYTVAQYAVGVILDIAQHIVRHV